MIITIMFLCHRKPISHQSSYYRNRPALFDESVVSNARDIICWLSLKIRLEHNIVVPIQSTNLLDSVLFCHLLLIVIDKIRRINTTWRSSRHGIIFCSAPSYRVVWSGPSVHRGVPSRRHDTLANRGDRDRQFHVPSSAVGLCFPRFCSAAFYDRFYRFTIPRFITSTGTSGRRQACAAVSSWCTTRCTLPCRCRTPCGRMGVGKSTRLMSCSPSVGVCWNKTRCSFAIPITNRWYDAAGSYRPHSQKKPVALIT